MKKKITAFILAAVMVFTLIPTVAHADGIAPAYLPSNFDFVFPGEFNEGFAVMQNQGKLIYIDTNGNQAFNGARFTYAESFQNGTAVVAMDSNYGTPTNYGIIDRTGKFVIPCQYSLIYNFREGLAAARNSSSRWGFVNEKNETVVPFLYYGLYGSAAKGFSDGLCPVQDGTTGAYYYINTTGNKVGTSYPYGGNFYLSDFNKGRAAVRDGSVWSFIDTTGTKVSNDTFVEAYPFLSDVALVNVNGKFGFINPDMTYKIEPTISSEISLILNIYGDDCYVLKTPSGYMGINGQGDILFSDKNYVTLMPFDNGYAKYQTQESGVKCGLIDKNGIEVTEAIFDSIEGINSDGIITGGKDGKLGFFTTTGEKIYDCDFIDTIRPFSERFACAKEDGTDNFKFILNPFWYPCIDDISVSDDGEITAKTFTVTLKPSLSVVPVLIVAAYGRGGRMTTMKTIGVTSDTITIKSINLTDAETIKLMMWGNIYAMEPLCLEETVKKVDNAWVAQRRNF